MTFNVCIDSFISENGEDIPKTVSKLFPGLITESLRHIYNLKMIILIKYFFSLVSVFGQSFLLPTLKNNYKYKCSRNADISAPVLIITKLNWK
jgi:hypothetical protein